MAQHTILPGWQRCLVGALYVLYIACPILGDTRQAGWMDYFKARPVAHTNRYFYRGGGADRGTSNSASDDVDNRWWLYVKRAPGSEFLGKRAPGSEFLGKRAPGSEFLGKRAPGSEFLGKRIPGSEFLGKRIPGSEFLGKRAPGSEFLGKRVPGSEFLGKRAPGSEFLGKRQYLDHSDDDDELIQELLAKRSMEIPVGISQQSARDKFERNAILNI